MPNFRFTSKHPHPAPGTKVEADDNLQTSLLAEQSAPEPWFEEDYGSLSTIAEITRPPPLFFQKKRPGPMRVKLAGYAVSIARWILDTSGKPPGDNKTRKCMRRERSRVSKNDTVRRENKRRNEQLTTRNKRCVLLRKRLSSRIWPMRPSSWNGAGFPTPKRQLVRRKWRHTHC